MTAAAPRHPSSGVVLDVVFAPLAAAPRLPVGLLSREQKAAELELLQKRRAIDAAREAELILGLAEEPRTGSTRRPMRQARSGAVGRRRTSCPESRSSSPPSWR